MRIKERIEPFLEKVKIRYVVKHIWKFHGLDASYIKHLFERNKDKIKTYWLDNPDLRFSQVLVNLEIIPNVPGTWYYMEEYEILEALGYKSEDVNYWGTNFDKDMNALEKTIWRPISELKPDHIENILNGRFANGKYKKIMIDVLYNKFNIKYDSNRV